jgi:hypothetical protein
VKRLNEGKMETIKDKTFERKDSSNWVLLISIAYDYMSRETEIERERKKGLRDKDSRFDRH